MNEQDQEKPGKKAGRPRRWKSGVRRIPRSEAKDHQVFQGDLEDFHSMNVQFEEARQLRGLIAGEIGEIQALLAQLDAMSDPSAAISDEECDLPLILTNFDKIWLRHSFGDKVSSIFGSGR